MSLQTYEKPNYYNVINTGIDSVVIDSTITVYAMGDAYSSAKLKTIFTAGASGAIVDKFTLSSTNAAAILVYIFTWDGVTSIKFKRAVSVPANSGTDGTAAIVDVISPTTAGDLPQDSTGKKYMRLKANHSVVIGVATAPAAGKFILPDIIGMDKG